MRQNSKKIAVTGGIGSGKSTVCNYISTLGYRVYSCDDVYSDVLDSTAVVDELAENFGNEIIGEGHVLDRKRLSEIVFNDREKLARLNAITHPKIFEAMFAKADADSENFIEVASPLIFFEVPLLFEGGYEKLFDAVLVVIRDKVERINSVALRDNMSGGDVKKRIENQFDYDNYDFAKYFVMHNDCDLCQLQQDTFNLIGKISLELLGPN